MIYGGIAKRDMICAMLKDISTLMDADCMYSVTDTECFIAYLPGKNVDIKAQIGAPVPPQSPLAAAAQQRKIVTKTMPKEVWGVAFRSTATPILDEKGQVVGCVGIGISIEREDNLLQTYHSFAKLLGEMTGLNETITQGMRSVEENNRQFVQLMAQANNNIKKANGFISQINSLSKTTDILSVNASVEAAHAGPQGKGFAIVAQEIKNLSSQTKSLAADIGKILAEINESFLTLSALSTENSGEMKAQLDALRNNQEIVRNMHVTASEYSKLLNV